ncbi:MAG: hypothetical protein LQ346_005375 [Caloplaca aetnensis]|nr:MAG: hypothetical protein LQ346_005375 [Caloplaca aetnensis]
MDRDSPPKFLDLPAELFIEIFHHLSKAELKILRQVCSRIKELANPLLFTTAYIATRRRAFDAFKNLSSHPDLSQHVVEIVYDCSWFDIGTAEAYRYSLSPTTAQAPRVYADARMRELHAADPESRKSRANYVEACEEQAKIVREELGPTVQDAVKNFPHVRRLIYADFSRASTSDCDCDRIEDLGGAFRLMETQWTWITWPSRPSHLCRTLFHPGNDHCCSRYVGLALFLQALSQPNCKMEISDLRIGDSTYAPGAGGIPDFLFLGLSDNLHGPSFPFKTLRKLDLTISNGVSARSWQSHQSFPQFPHLELLRLVAPPCPPVLSLSAPVLREPAIQLSDYCGQAHWPRLRALELRWIASGTIEFLSFLNRHKDTLRFINLSDIYIHERSNWKIIVRGLRSMFPSLIVEHSQEYQRYPQDLSNVSDAVLLDFNLYNGLATLDNVRSTICHWEDAIDIYEVDQASNYSATEGSVDQDEESNDSEELEFSEGGDSSDFDT